MAVDATMFRRFRRRSVNEPDTPPLPLGEGGGEGLHTADRAHPLTLFPLPVGEGTGGNRLANSGKSIERRGDVPSKPDAVLRHCIQLWSRG
jgi:hypothetical protein